MELSLTPNRASGRADVAYQSIPANIYSNVHVGDGGRSHLGNSYNFGPTEDQQILQAILQSLHYPEMGRRGLDVSDAKADTFEWLFEEGGSETSHSFEDSGLDETERRSMATKLRCWLKNDGDSVFWITGKPGSGKSTFMKFLRDHDGTDALLQEWARDDMLIVADHFFWLPGTHLQNSFEGLVRSLMHAILSSLAADIASAKSICGKRRWSLQSSRRPWPRSEFKRMFDSIGAISSVRFFLLVDGLDECCPQDSHDDLMDTLMGMIGQPNVKACLSSRPWREFVMRLECSPSLRLDHITRLDMITYIREKILKATREQGLTARETRELIRLVIDRASGVFLWVELVVRAINVELKKDRGVSRVTTIVREFPSELDEYFATLIYERIEKSSGNESDTASVLSLALHREHQRREQFYLNDVGSFIDYWLLSRGATEHDLECPSTETPKYDRAQVDVMIGQTRKFLELTTRDLLVLSSSLEVGFLHRCVYDFLTDGWVSNAIHQQLPAHVQRADFFPNLTVLRCVHALMMTEIECGEVDALLASIVFFPGLDNFTQSKRNAILRACESLAIEHLHAGRFCFGQVRISQKSWSSSQHQIGTFMSEPWQLVRNLIPYRYVRTVFLQWPHTVHTMLIRDNDFIASRLADTRRLADLELRNLCSACTDIIHDCLYLGLLPNDWMGKGDLLSRVGFSPVTVSREFLQSDDGPQHSVCEYCHVHLPYSKDCGLRDKFLLFEMTAFESRVPKNALLRHSSIGSSKLELRIANLLPFDIPQSMLCRAGDLQTLSDDPRFREFVWSRQKLRAARSFLVTTRRHLSIVAKLPPSFDSNVHELGSIHPFHQIQQVRLSFLDSFVQPDPARDSEDRSRYRYEYGCCGERINAHEDVVVILQPDEFPLFCKGCYRRTAPQRGSGPSFTFTIQLQIASDDPWDYCDDNVLAVADSRTETRGIAHAVSTIIAWYSATAPAYGLGHTIPSDMKAIQEALLTIPETPV